MCTACIYMCVAHVTCVSWWCMYASSCPLWPCPRLPHLAVMFYLRAPSNCIILSCPVLPFCVLSCLACVVCSCLHSPFLVMSCLVLSVLVQACLFIVMPLSCIVLSDISCVRSMMHVFASWCLCRVSACVYHAAVHYYFYLFDELRFSATRC